MCALIELGLFEIGGSRLAQNRWPRLFAVEKGITNGLAARFYQE